VAARRRGDRGWDEGNATLRSGIRAAVGTAIWGAERVDGTLDSGHLTLTDFGPYPPCSPVARLSPITIALSLLLLLALAALVYALSRPRPERAAHETDLDAIEGSAGGLAPPRPLVDLRRNPIPSSPRPPTTHENEPIVDDGTAAQLNEWRRWQARPPINTGAFVRASRRYRSIRRTDETLLPTLNLDDSGRAAIRKITAEHRPMPAPLLRLSPEDASTLLEGDEAARRAAIEAAVGPNVAKQLFAAEDSATRPALEPDGGRPLISTGDGGTGPSIQPAASALSARPGPDSGP
jgi:hypothetical protein